MANKQFKVPINLVNLASDPGTASEGDVYYNTTSDTVKVYANGAWASIGSGGGGGSASDSFKTISVSGQSDVIADSSTDTLTIVPGTGITITTNANTDAITLGVTSSTYQPLDADLTAIAALTGTSGILKKTAADTWALDTSTYLTSAVTSITAGTGLSGGTITSTGTIALATAYGDTTNPYASKTANYVLASPNGTAGVPTFRALVAADIPTLGNVTNAGAIGSTANLVAVTTTSGVLTTATATNQSATTFLRGDLSWVTPTDTNDYPTAITMTAGTTAGPVVNLTMSGATSVTSVAIPSASGTASGIITTGAQTFAGVKTFSSNPNVTGIDTSVTSGTFALVNTGLTGTLNIGGAVTGNINIGSSSSTTVIAGDLTVNGTTTTINTATLSVDDINIELGSVTTPTDVTAAGGGITLRGATDKTFNWTSAAAGWTSSENISLAAGKDILLNGATSGTITLEAVATAGTNTITIPATTGTMYVSGGTDIALTDGGTNASLTASNGGIVYSTASAMAILSGTATAGQILRSGASGAPSWSTATFPSTATTSGTILRANGTNWLATTSTFADTYAVNTILYAGTANTVTGLATANSSVLVTSASGVPSLSTTLPQVTLTTPNIGAATGTSLTTTGSIVYHLDTTVPTLNAGNTYKYTLVLTDDGDLVEMNTTTGVGNTLEVPLNSSVAFPVGTQITVLQIGLGQTTISGAAGVTLNSTPGAKLRAQWSSASLIKRATDTWVLIGDLTA